MFILSIQEIEDYKIQYSNFQYFKRKSVTNLEINTQFFISNVETLSAETPWIAQRYEAK